MAIPSHWPKPANEKLERVYEALFDAGATFGGGQDWSCPAHEDERASLGVTAGEKQPVILKCQAGCKPGEILEALGLTPDDISNRSTRTLESKWKWTYTDEVGHPLIDVYRFDYSDGSKDYRQGPAGTGKFGTVKAIRNTLYNLPAVLRQVDSNGVVWVVEGERSAEALIELGEVATTQRQGASQSWPGEFTHVLLGASEVRIVADFDAAGFKRALAVGRALHREKIPVTVWRSATTGKGDDIVDHLAAMKSKDELVRLSSEELKAQIEEWSSDEDTNDNQEREVWPNANTPLAVARQYVDTYHKHRVCPTLVFWRDEFHEWDADSNFYRTIEDMEMRHRLYSTFDSAVVETELGPKPWVPTKEKLNRVLDALQALSHVSGDLDRAWRSSRRAANVISFRNGNYDIDSKTLSPPTPDLLSQLALPFDYDPDAPKPVRWFQFLHELFPDDTDSQRALQEWFGYVLSGRLNLHSMFAIVGPKRSGKSTVAEILKRLVGFDNTTSPTLQSMTTGFGLSSWLGKTLAVIEDARFNPKNTEQTTELLLRISSGNAVEVDRKFKHPRSVVLPTRIMYVSNEFPNIVDHSGALFSRFVFLRTTRTFAGMEDRELVAKLTEELPGIMLWSLDGLYRVLDQGQFTRVRSMETVKRDIEEMQSPIKGFMRDRCERVTGAWTSKADLYEAYQQWCVETGVKYVPTQVVFGRNLLAAYPTLSTSRVRLDGVQIWGYDLVSLKTRRTHIPNRSPGRPKKNETR